MEINVLWLLQNHLSLRLAHFGEKLLLAEIDFNLPIEERTNGTMHGTLKCARIAGTYFKCDPIMETRARHNRRIGKFHETIEPSIHVSTR